jgi:hypothetical protein
MLSMNPNNLSKKDKIFRHGIDYNTKASGMGLGKPDIKAMKMNYSNSLKPNENDIIRNKKISEEYRKSKNFSSINTKKSFLEKLLDFNLRSIIPLKLMAFLYNLPSFSIKNIKKYIKAEWSSIEEGPVSLSVYNERKRICGACPHKKKIDGYKDPLGFCTKCGCGANPRAQLTVKLKLPAASCPIDKWGEEKGIYEGFWGRIIYILCRNKKGQDNGSI